MDRLVHPDMIRTTARRSLKLPENQDQARPRVFFTNIPPFFQFHPTHDHERFVETAVATGADVRPAIQSPSIDMAENVPIQDLEPYYTTFDFPDDYTIDIQQLLQHVYQRMLTHHYLTQIMRFASKFPICFNIAPYVPYDCALSPRPSHLENCTLQMARREYDTDDVTYDVTNGDLAILDEIARALNLMTAKTSEFRKAQATQLRNMACDSKPLTAVAILNDAMAASLYDVRRATNDLLVRVTLMRRREALNVAFKPPKKQLAALLTLPICHTDDMFPGRITVFSFTLTFLIVTLAYAPVTNLIFFKRHSFVYIFHVLCTLYVHVLL